MALWWETSAEATLDRGFLFQTRKRSRMLKWRIKFISKKFIFIKSHLKIFIFHFSFFFFLSFIPKISWKGGIITTIRRYKREANFAMTSIILLAFLLTQIKEHVKQKKVLTNMKPPSTGHTL
jgi:hypothetical protein